MGISGIGIQHYPAWQEAGRAQKNSSGIGFASRMADMVGTNASQNGRKTNAVSGRDNYVGGDAASIYGMYVYSREEISASQDLNLPIETERYKIEDASYLEGVPAYEIVDKLTGRGLYIREDQLMVQKDEKTGLEFVINMDQPFSCNVQMTEELKGFLDEIAGKRGIDLQEVPMQGGLTVNQDPKTGLRYLSIQGNEAKGVSVVITSKEDWETLEKLADEFQKYAVCSQRRTAGLYALLEISGNLKRGDEGFTYLTPDGITYIPYDGNPDKAWEIAIPASDYSAARKYLAMGIEASNYQTWLRKFNSAKLLESDAGPLNHFSNGRVLADKESEKVDRQESKTKTDIIVRPDGSRVLVMTMNIGGMETTMSLEISKPTEAPNDNSKQDIYKALRTTNQLKGQEENSVSETVQARFPLEEVDEEGNRKEELYLIAVDKDGIRCSKPGQDEYEWEILFTDESQYENATEFLNYAGEFMDNFRFAAHENFWEDYLNGNMAVDEFKEFLKGTNNGVPDYSFTVGDSMYIDEKKARWAPYMNPLGAKFYTEEEMARMRAELIEKNTASAHKLSDPYSILYKKLHPEYNGERIFCEYPGGPLYTADEIMERMNRNSQDAKYQAEARKNNI